MMSGKVREEVQMLRLSYLKLPVPPFGPWLETFHSSNCLNHRYVFRSLCYAKETVNLIGVFFLVRYF